MTRWPKNRPADEDQVKASGRPVQVTRLPEWSGTGRDLPAVRIAGRGDTHRPLALLVSASKPAATVSSGLAPKPASAADGAHGAIAEFASRLSKVIDGQIDFRPCNTHIFLASKHMFLANK